ncbi:hypothetical protein K491DRAFT_778468 [Lophiostoma macrostomum CBS 122681]|uniref:RING-type domain-containing protein n=1 Tax=Lophiostoma macrostomum CBS 122681 TaxID=1314788 RepID=A0A6A6TA33_9PLEO|nr:hypothetical protein K491DRAFT_778468 [Lophiostoma macrostomum CBS 122681]
MLAKARKRSSTAGKRVRIFDTSNYHDDPSIRPLYMPPGAVSEFHFRGGGSVLQPNHITRYVYPTLLGYPKSALRLQMPSHAATRSRPHDQGMCDNTFVTISPVGKPRPNKAQFQSWIVNEKERDKKCPNPVGRAMRRVTGFRGNTMLECGKFKLGPDRLVYVLKRTTVLWCQEQGQQRTYATDTARYEIRADKWRDMRPRTAEPDEHDCWWVRLYDLMNGSYDRAYWAAKEQMESVGVVAPIVRWLPRPDLEQQKIKIIRTGGSQPEGEDMCMICSEDYFTETDYPVLLPCKHCLCLPCMVKFSDMADNKLDASEVDKDPGCPFWRCPLCRHIMPVKYDRLSVVKPDEFNYWRWYTMKEYMEKKMSNRDFNTYLSMAMYSEYIPHFDVSQNNGIDIAKTQVRAKDAIQFIEKFAIPVYKLMPYGYSTDNPVTFPESDWLLKAIKHELQSLESGKQAWTLPSLTRHFELVTGFEKEVEFVPDPAFPNRKQMKRVRNEQQWRNSIGKCVIDDKQFNLGNPIVPPGYDVYRKYLCGWTAKGCFLAPDMMVKHYEFVARLGRENRVWWKGHELLKS